MLVLKQHYGRANICMSYNYNELIRAIISTIGDIEASSAILALLMSILVVL
jgi:hypothetical protein